METQSYILKDHLMYNMEILYTIIKLKLYNLFKKRVDYTRRNYVKKYCQFMVFFLQIFQSFPKFGPKPNFHGVLKTSLLN